jgi:rhodanese-related sulfurtransferase
MSILNYFKPVSTWSAEKIRKFLQEKNPGDYNLVDVRAPKEYEQGHLPGARLIPVGELASRLSEIDPKKPTVVYWAAGLRSRAAAATLTDAGFGEVYSMQGGINAWKGWVAEGAPESGMAYFSPASKPEELMALAWYLEDGSQKFYSEVVKMLEDQQAKDLFKTLSEAEEGHKASLLKLYKEFSGVITGERFPTSVISPEGEGDVMAYDLYLKMKHHTKDEASANVFQALSGEEKQHLERLSSLLEERL